MAKRIAVSTRRLPSRTTVFFFPLARESLPRSTEAPSTDTLPFENYRTNPVDDSINHFLPQPNRVSQRNNNRSAGASRLSDDDDEREGNAQDGDNHNNENEHVGHSDQLERRPHDPYVPPSSRTSNLSTEPFARSKLSSSFIDSSVHLNSNAPSALMMMTTKGNGVGDEPRPVAAMQPNSSGSSSTSSSVPGNEQQHQQKNRRFNFVPAPFNGARLMAKSTEQLNRSFPQDSLMNYCTPPTFSSAPLGNRSNSPTSILKHNFLQKYTPSATIVHTSSKTSPHGPSVRLTTLHDVHTNLAPLTVVVIIIINAVDSSHSRVSFHIFSFSSSQTSILQMALTTRTSRKLIHSVR